MSCEGMTPHSCPYTVVLFRCAAERIHMGNRVRYALIIVASVSSAGTGTDNGCHQHRFETFSEWSQPTNLGAVVNSNANENWPAISPNGLSLYFASDRSGGFGLQDIWVTHRAKQDGPWEPPRYLGPNINTQFRDNSPTLSRDGHWLAFGSSRIAGRCRDDSNNEFFVSYRENTDDDFGWEPAVNFGCEISGMGENAGLTLLEEDENGTTTLYFSSDRPGGPGKFDIYVTGRRLDGAFGPPVVVPELSSARFDTGLSVRTDGLEMFLCWNSLHNVFGDCDLWVSTRENTAQPWSAPKNLGKTINTAGTYASQPALSCDATSLYFSSNRPGGLGAGDLYVTTRHKVDNAAPVVDNSKAPVARGIQSRDGPERSHRPRTASERERCGLNENHHGEPGLCGLRLLGPGANAKRHHHRSGP